MQSSVSTRHAVWSKIDSSKLHWLFEPTETTRQSGDAMSAFGAQKYLASCGSAGEWNAWSWSRGHRSTCGTTLSPAHCRSSTPGRISVHGGIAALRR